MNCSTALDIWAEVQQWFSVWWMSYRTSAHQIVQFILNLIFRHAEFWLGLNELGDDDNNMLNYSPHCLVWGRNPFSLNFSSFVAQFQLSVYGWVAMQWIWLDTWTFTTSQRCMRFASFLPILLLFTVAWTSRNGTASSWWFTALSQDIQQLKKMENVCHYVTFKVTYEC